MNIQEMTDPPRPSVEVSLSDQHFLLNFIMSTYLGPDVMSDNPRRSGSQRLAEGLPPYTLSDLGPSFVTILQLESLYYYVLRNAQLSLALKPNLLHMYLKGNLLLPSSGLSEDSEQFTSFFPSSLHEQTSYSENFTIVKGIVPINDPVTSYMKQEDLEKFRCLSGIDNLKIDIDESLQYQKYIKDWGERMAGKSNIPNEICKLPDESKKRCQSYPHEMQVSTYLYSQHPPKTLTFPRTCNWYGCSATSLSSLPYVEECMWEASISLTGTAREGRAGPPIGAVDIGVGSAAYLFRVSLPGVRKDNRQFSCDIEYDGKVHIQGVTSTGDRTIVRHRRVYHMKIQNLCPPGQFSISFSLPGPVDPRLFSPNFRDDGIFEAVVVKME